MKSLVMSYKKLKAFTLVELLVVISIIALLVAIVLPAISGALFKGKMTAALANGRGIQQSIFAKDTESVYTTTSASWPILGALNEDTGTYPDSSAYLLSLVTNGTLNVGLNYFVGPGIPTAPTGNDFETDLHNMWAIVSSVSDSTSETLPVIFSRNFKISEYGTAVYNVQDGDIPADLGTATFGSTAPFADKGFVFITKSGAGYSLFKDDLKVGTDTAPGPFRTLFNIEDFNGTAETNDVLRPAGESGS